MLCVNCFGKGWKLEERISDYVGSKDFYPATCQKCKGSGEDNDRKSRLKR